MKMVDKSSKLDKFSANMNASTSAGACSGGGSGGGVVGNTGATGGGMNTGHGVSNISGHYYHAMQQQQQQQHHGGSGHHQNGQKPVPMKLFAAWEVDRSYPTKLYTKVSL